MSKYIFRARCEPRNDNAIWPGRFVVYELAAIGKNWIFPKIDDIACRACRRHGKSFPISKISRIGLCVQIISFDPGSHLQRVYAGTTSKRSPSIKFKPR